MIITLYKNSQHEADMPSMVYQDKWSAFPYEPDSMFCAGETVEEKEFMLPAGITFNKTEFMYKTDSLCVLSTNDKGQPVLALESNRFASFILLTQEEMKQAKPASVPPPIKKEKVAWIPGRDKNGEWEIF